MSTSNITIDVERAFYAYLDCALWSSTDMDDPEGRTFDRQLADFDDIAQESRNEHMRELREFIKGNRADCERFADEYGDEAIGHDFWLTRNRHGAGFWDRGAGELGERLTRAAHPYGECYLCRGDDGRIHIEG